MPFEYAQPKNLREMLDYIKKMIQDIDSGQKSREEAAYRIVGATMGNTFCDRRQYYEQYPDLETLVELAADLELVDVNPNSITLIDNLKQERYDAWIEESWQTLRTLLAKLDDIVP